MPKFNLADLELPDDVLEIIETRNADVSLEKFLAVLIQLGASEAQKALARAQECAVTLETIDSHTKH